MQVFCEEKENNIRKKILLLVLILLLIQKNTIINAEALGMRSRDQKKWT